MQKGKRKWDAAIVEALRAAGEPLRPAEVGERVLGRPPHPKWVCFQSALHVACRRGLIRRIGTAARGADGYRYELPLAADAVDPQVPK